MNYWRKLLVIVVGLAMLTSCAGVPVSGPVRKVTAHPSRLHPGVEIAPAPPGPDVTPTEAVEGFLHAMAAYQPDYLVARAYLTPSASESWTPTSGVSVYAEGFSVVVGKDGASLEAPLIARLSPDGSLTQASGMLRHDFGLVKDERGQWRISNPPDGLLVSQYLFASAFERHPIYFWAAGQRWLVPDLRYFRRGNQALLETARAVVAGPSEWLAPGVAAVPDGVSVEEVFVTASGVAVVTLGRNDPELSESQQAAVAVQMVWSFRQFPSVNAVSLHNAGGEAWMVPESSSGVIPKSAYVNADPVTRDTSHQLFAVSQGRIARVGEGSQASAIEDAGARINGVREVAVNSDVSQVAVVAGNTLSTISLPDGDPAQILQRSGLGRPSFSRFGELWVPDASDSLTVRTGDDWADVPLEGVSGAKILSARLSPDGVRAVLIVMDASGRQRAGIVLVVREDEKIGLVGWRPLFVAAAEGRSEPDVLDAGWANTSELILLTREGANTSVMALGSDGSSPTSVGTVTGNELVEIAVAPDAPLVVLSATGQVFHYYADYRWSLLVNNVSAIEYPG